MTQDTVYNSLFILGFSNVGGDVVVDDDGGDDGVVEVAAQAAADTFGPMCVNLDLIFISGLYVRLLLLASAIGGIVCRW